MQGKNCSRREGSRSEQKQAKSDEREMQEGYVLLAGSPISATCTDSGSGGEFDNVGASCVAVCAGVFLVPLRTLPAGLYCVSAFAEMFQPSLKCRTLTTDWFVLCFSLPGGRIQHGVAFR